MNQLPEGLNRIGAALAERSGYLRNVIPASNATCQICSAPVDGYVYCYRCNQDRRSGHAIADRVASMVYAIEPGGTRTDQTYTVMRGYKADRPLALHVDTMTALLMLGVAGHANCDFLLSGMANFSWATVPSTRGGGGEHPLHRILTSFWSSDDEISIAPSKNIQAPRELRPENFEIESTIPRSTHVELIDDSWVTGGRAQSIAAALKVAGAESVSILTVARVMKPTYGPNAEFIREHLRGDFDYMVCPWTGGACP